MKVIIIGRNYTSRLGMIRALGICGYDIYVIRTMYRKSFHSLFERDVDGFSKYVKGYYIAYEPDREHLISVINSIGSGNSLDKDILVPVDDFSASTIDEYSEVLKNNFYFPNINMQQGAITNYMDKSIQKQIAMEVGLNVANGHVVISSDGVYKIPTDISYPCFPKPLVSFKGNKICMKKCNNENELINAIEQVIEHQKDCSFEIEEYITINKEYATLGFSDGSNVVLPAMIEIIKDGCGSHKGVTMLGKVVSTDSFTHFLSLLKTFILKIGFVGLFDIDTYESNGKLFFNELNLRFGASGYAITASGINLPSMYINCMTGLSCITEFKLKNETIFLNEKVALDDFLNGYMSYKEYRNITSMANIRFIECKDDFLPNYIFKLKVVKEYVKKIIKSFIKAL